MIINIEQIRLNKYSDWESMKLSNFSFLKYTKIISNTDFFVYIYFLLNINKLPNIKYYKLNTFYI